MLKLQTRMGQKGWHNRGYLPHYDGWGVTQHVVFRLHDSIPPTEQEGDDILDRHLGSCVLREARCANIVVGAVLHRDEAHYMLQAWCVMPNHVHVLLATNREHELGKVVGLWKAYSAARINRLLGRSGRLWAPDYFDRYIRDQTHFETTKHYIEMNPVTAGLCENPAQWRFSSAGYNRHSS